MIEENIPRGLQCLNVRQISTTRKIIIGRNYCYATVDVTILLGCKDTWSLEGKSSFSIVDFLMETTRVII